MESVLVRDVKVQHGRNRGMRHRLYAEADPFTNTTERVPAELALCKRIGDLLSKHYAGHPWMVNVDAKQGIAQISIPVLLGNWSYILHMDKIDDQVIVKAGGEILERFKIPRTTIDIAAYLTALDTIPMIGNFRARDRQRIPG